MTETAPDPEGQEQPSAEEAPQEQAEQQDVNIEGPTATGGAEAPAPDTGYSNHPA